MIDCTTEEPERDFDKIARRANLDLRRLLLLDSQLHFFLSST